MILNIFADDKITFVFFASNANEGLKCAKIPVIMRSSPSPRPQGEEVKILIIIRVSTFSSYI